MVDGNGHEPEALAAQPALSEGQLRALSILLDRQSFMRLAGVQFEGRRDLYRIFGYDRVISSQQYRDEYARGGIAKRIVEAFPKATWRGGVELFEDEDPEKDTAFEKAWKEFEKKFGVWNLLQNADILAGLSTYSIILLGAIGNLDEELPRGKNLLYLRPFFGGGGPGDQRSSTQSIDTDATVEEFDKDPQSPRFGEPLFYRIQRVGTTSLPLKVHWTRVIHVCEGALDNDVYGVPTLESVWNLLADLQKVTGGGAESFFQRAKHSLNVNIQKDVAFQPTDLTDLRSKLDDYEHGITDILTTRGTDVKLLEATAANFVGPTDAILKQIAGSKGIPMRILTGSEMGSLASEQDAANFDSQVQDRRTGYAGPQIVRKLVDRLIAYGYLPEPAQYDVGWPEEEEDKNLQAEYGVKLATINKTQGSPVVTDDEIREMAFGLQPLTEEQKQAIADEAAKKVANAQAAMTAKPEEDGVGSNAPEVKNTLKALEEAIEADDIAKIAELIGVSNA